MVSALTEKVVVGEGDGSTAEPVHLSGTAAVAQMLGCSPRHVRKLCDSGRMPRPIKLSNRLIRWPHVQIEECIAGGCRPVEKGGTKP